MFRFLVILKLCSAGLKIWSPDQLVLFSIDNAIASFGDPVVFPKYGKLAPLYSSGDCSFFESFTRDTFAILYGFSGCHFSDLAIWTQKSGGIGVIIVSDDENINYTMLPKDEVSKSHISILSIMIKKSAGEKISQYLNKQIWVTYSLDLEPIRSQKIDFHMSSNYTLDKAFISVFQEMVTKFSINLTDFSIEFSTSSKSENDIDYSNDCLTSSSNTYCLPHSSNVTGSQKIKNSAVIINYYNTLSGPASEFLNFLTTLYSTCESTYSTECIQNVLTNTSSTLTANTSLASLHNNPSLKLTPFYIFNYNLYYSPKDIEKIYCMSVSPPPQNCQECSPGCTYRDLLSPICKDSCNVESCGFQMLTCKKIGGCYDFELNDGNCNNRCACDPDCDCKENEMCAEGCAFFIIKEGKCPMACTGKCFAYCTSEYCSPDCLYSAMDSGECPEACTEDCKSKCNSEYCGPGCRFEDMKNGLCPVECAGDCFNHCSAEFCSPGCLNSNINSTYCPESCAEKCCKYEVQSTNYLLLLCLFLLGILVLLILISCYFAYKKGHLLKKTRLRARIGKQNDWHKKNAKSA